MGAVEKRVRGIRGVRVGEVGRKEIGGLGKDGVSEAKDGG